MPDDDDAAWAMANLMTSDGVDRYAFVEIAICRADTRRRAPPPMLVEVERLIATIYGRSVTIVEDE